MFFLSDGSFPPILKEEDEIKKIVMGLHCCYALH